MGLYQRMKASFEKEYKERSEIYRRRLSAWRVEPAVSPLERPTNLARARVLGFKAKQGFKVVRVRLARGQRKRPMPSGGRKPGKNIMYLSPGISLRAQAEQRAARKYRNMEVLNSYWVGQDGQKKYFEVILVEPKAYGKPIRSSRAFNGLTSAFKKVRGLHNKGVGSEQARRM
ncbi:MAG: 50S ribosomal protein L15e [Candidatus Micrarchaeota archaeon]